MSSPIRPADWEHFSIVRESLSLDGLHVAMVGSDRRQLLDYAATLAIKLSNQDGWHIEKYDPHRLETIIVDLMLNRFDAALQTLSDHRSAPSPRPWGCVIFIPDAQSIPGAAFQQLIRLAAGTQNRRLRLVALFDRNEQVFEDRISTMGTQVARWDLDDDGATEDTHTLLPGAIGHIYKPRASGGRYCQPGRLLAATTIAVGLAVLSLIWPRTSDISFTLPADGQASIHGERVPALAGTLGPESLPITLPPEHAQGNDAAHVDEQRVHSDEENGGQSEAVDQ